MRAGHLILAAMLAASIVAADLVGNGGAEMDADGGGPAGWIFRAARGHCRGNWDNQHAASGNHSLQLAIPQDDHARAHWVHTAKISVEPDTTYRLSAKMLVGNVTGEAYLICYENGKGDPAHWHDTKHISGTHDWREYSVEFETRQDAEWLRLVCKLRHGTGHAWFDDITLQQVADARKKQKKEARKVRTVPPDDGFPLQAMWSAAQWCRNDVIHLLRDETNPLALFFRGARDEINAPKLVVAVTEGVSIIGPVVRGRGPMPEPVTVQPEALERDGKDLRCWRLPIPEESMANGLRDQPRWTQYHHIYARVDANCPDSGRLYWWLEVDGRRGPQHSLPIRVPPEPLPQLDPPDNFRMYVQHTGALRHPDPGVRRELVHYLKTAGIVGGLGISYYEPNRIAVDEQYQQMGMQMHTWRFEAYRGTAPEKHRLVDLSGKTSKSSVCPQSQIEHVQPWYDNLRQYYRKKLSTGLKRLIIDYEPPTFDVCFCDRCREAFARRFDLPMEECLQLPAKQLRDKYERRWGLFRADQNGAIVKTHCDVVHEIDPDVDVGLCSWRGTEWLAERGADIRKFEPEAAFHAPMIYTEGLRFHSLVSSTCRRTTAPVLPFVELSDISQPRSLTAEQLHTNLLACGLSGGRGAFLWVGMECLDAGYMQQTARAVRQIGKLRNVIPLTDVRIGPRPADGDNTAQYASDWLTVEPEPDSVRTIHVNGADIELMSPNPIPYLRWHIWGTSDGVMAAFLNYHSEDTFDMRVKSRQRRAGKFAIIRPLSGKRRDISARELHDGVVVSVPAKKLVAVAVRQIHQ